MTGLLPALTQRSISRRLVGALLVAAGLVWAGLYVQARHAMGLPGSGGFDADMTTLAETVRRVAEAHADPVARAAALHALAVAIDVAVEAGDTPKGFQSFVVRTADGHPVADSGNAPRLDNAGTPASGHFEALAGAERFRVYRLATGDRSMQIDIIQSHASRQQIFDAVMISQQGLIVPVLIGLPLLLLPVWLAVHTGLSPLRRLTRELAQRQPGDLSPLTIPPVYRELAPVVRELNGTMDRLQRLLQRERDFLADAAHELRTPLALISAQADSLSSTRDPELRDAAAQRLRTGIARASRLVNQLLSLARLEADVEDRPVATDLADLVRDGLAACAHEAGDRGIALTYVGPNSLVTRCPAQAVASILDNLVGNAIRYGRPGGQVELRLSRAREGAIQLAVRDDGPGIPDADRQMVFERFVRGSRTTASGSGLGLAIVQSAARQLGASIDLQDGLGGMGVGFVVGWQPRDTSDAPAASAG